MTVACATGTQDIADIFAETGEELDLVLAHSIDWIGNNKVLVPQDEGRHAAPPLPRLRPQDRPRRPRASPDVQRMLLEWTRTPIERWHRKHWPKLEKLGYVEATHGAARRAPRAVPDRGRRRRVRPPCALLLHLRPDLVGDEAVRARRRMDGRRELRSARPGMKSRVVLFRLALRAGASVAPEGDRT